ncbi:MAG: ABC transporter ATP-binding protein/permease [Methylococcales bacterium]|nr:ABC transporter ATP-binding protein/permease [Methylococcales bacterium]
MLVESYTEKPTEDRKDWRNIKRLLPTLWQYRTRVVVALGCLFAAKMANVGIPLVLKEIVDALEQHKTAVLMLPVFLLVVYGALRLSSSLFNEVRDALFARVRYGVMRKLSVQVLEHLHNLPLRFHLERQTGAISRDLDRGTRSLSTLMNFLVFSVLPTLAEFILIASILLVQYEASFAIIMFTSVAVYIGFTLMVTEWRMHYRLDMNKLDSQASTQAVDSLINYETVKYFNNEQLEINRYDKTLNEWEDTAVKSFTSMTLLNFGQGAIIACGVTLIMFFAAQGVVDGSLSLGDLVLINAFLLQLFIPLNSLGIVYRQIKYSLADMDLLVKLLDQTTEIKDAPKAQPLAVKEGEIEFRNINFSYQDDRQILFDFNLKVAAGKKIAIVGSSGAGKSTLARLLYRFYDAQSGEILIDGQPIKSVTQNSLREAIGIVPQDTVLFNDTLHYNLAYARTDADDAALTEAAEMAQIHGFITELPQQYETVVGERGLKLSGGEKQRVAIARAILKKTQILIFDEATSSLDSKTEQSIQETLKSVAARHTALVIAHRLSTIIDADSIVVMDKGRIIEQGTHSELLAQNSHYAEMWHLQQEEKIEQAES